jgi:predicted nucleotidyltransferase
MITKDSTHGITRRSFTQILKVFKKFSEVERVVIFGSRAMKFEKKGSDIDLVVYGSKVNDEILHNIKILLNEKFSIPYFIDVLDYKSIKNEDLLEHINNEGKVIYDRMREKSKQ